MAENEVIVFSRFGMGDAPPELQLILVQKLLSLWIQSGNLPEKIIFYTQGVKLACVGSPVLEQLKQMENQGLELILCKTCLDFFQLSDQVEVGIVGGMGDIIEILQKAKKILFI